MKTNLVRCLLLAAATLPSFTFSATQLDIAGPTGSGAFGTTVTVLPNGNFVVTDPGYDQPAPPVSNVGAVYLYSPEGVLISKLTGSTANNEVGSNGIAVLTNGNFIVKSHLWDNGAALNAGAVTWGSMTTGFGAASVTVSAANSIVGSNTSDEVGDFLGNTLPNGNYMVVTPDWGVSDFGAVTFGNGKTGTSGTVSAANSLVGSTLNDRVGSYGAIVVGNSNYVVISPLWNIPASTAKVGAVTWVNGSTGIPTGAAITGATVSTANSITGTTANDSVGKNGAYALPSGGYVVVSSEWNVPAGAVKVGAVTFALGNGGTAGAVSSTNSLVGVTANDGVGAFGVTVLTNGNYVVGSPQWNIPAGATLVGAVTWCSGTTGRQGPVTAANSLTGTTSGDRIGGYGIFPLTNGNYVVASGDWSIPSGATTVGAVTFCNGTTGLVGSVSIANSLIGSTPGDNISSVGVVPLTNGNYVVRSPLWNTPGGGALTGAVTWGSGTTGVKGAISAANSLIGGTAFDVAGDDSVIALTNGNYVVSTAYWDAPGGNTDVGAVTWGNGATGVKGVISASNSLVGKTAADSVGTGGIFALTNGNYVVSSPGWSNPSPATPAVGAVTWCNGATGTKGTVTSANSLVGNTTNDEVGGSGIRALSNGNYYVRSPSWHNGSVVSAGAVTWGSGTSGVKGVISVSNSLVGSSVNDQVGGQSTAVFNDGNAVFVSRSWTQFDGTIDVGAVTLANGTSGTTGVVNGAHSVSGTTTFGGLNMDFDYDVSRAQLIVGRPLDNKVTLLGNRFRSLAKTNLAAPGALDIAFSTVGSAAVNAVGAVATDFTLTGAGSASGKNRAIFGNVIASDPLDLVLQTGTNVSALGTGLPSNAKVLTVLNPLNQQSARALFQATISGTGITGSSNKLLLKDNGFSVSVVQRTGRPIGVGPLAAASASAFNEVLQSQDQDLIAIHYTLAANSLTPVNSSSDTGVLMVDHNGQVNINLGAREGQPAFGGGGTFGQFTGRGAAGVGSTIHFAASFKPTTGSAVNALFRMNDAGTITARSAAVGDLLAIPFVTGDTAVKFASIPAFTLQGALPLFKATLSGCASSANEGLFRSASVKIVRKGDDVDATNLPGVKFGSVSRFWPAGADQVVMQCTLSGTGVTSSNNQALVLRQANGSFYVLLRTGTATPGIDAAKISAFSAVDVNPVNGRYVVLAALTGAPSASNQALWTGNSSLGADTPAASQALRLPLVRLRKGDRYTTTATPLGIIKSITLKPAVDATGAGGRGLAQCIGSGGDAAVYILGDRSLMELVMLAP